MSEYLNRGGEIWEKCDDGSERELFAADVIKRLVDSKQSTEELERDLAEAKDKMLNNPFCAACKEPDCCVSGDGTCAMIRKYLTPSQWWKHHLEEMADGMQYAERNYQSALLLERSYEMIESIAHDRHWETAQQWLDDYKKQFPEPKKSNPHSKKPNETP